MAQEGSNVRHEPSTARRARDKSNTTEEPCAWKLASTVLETSRERRLCVLSSTIWCSFAVILHISTDPLIYRPTRDSADACGPRRLRCPRDTSAERRNPLSSRHRHKPSLPAYYLMPPHCASRRVRSMTPRRRSPCWCARRRPPSPVRSAPFRRVVSTAIMNAPWPICRGRRTACAYSCASASGFAAIANALGASSPNGCRRWRPLGPGARCGSPSAWWLLPWRWVARPGCV